ncbi:hypothetical protein CHU98_g2089 [Xylaria longipes]|nr:hypothetical protein CHU98_g2089 [Xylaria longipes]
MHEVPTAAQATTALTCWQAFAAEGTKIMTAEAALRARYEQLYPLHPLADAHQPNPVRFYGPGPDGRVHPHDPPIGTLHFARWRHELAAIEDPEGGGYHDEQDPLVIEGQRKRPTYTTKSNQTAREVNYSLWEKVPADSMKDVKTYPGSNATRATYEEYLLNEDDFNHTDDQKPKVTADLNNRQDEDPKNIYPLGYQLLKKWSKTNGHTEWEEGECLGPNPHSPDALTKHLGWFPKRLRMKKAGLGADPQDAVWNKVFHGNLDVKPKEKFVPPKAKWSEDPDKVTTLTSSRNSYKVHYSRFSTPVASQQHAKYRFQTLQIISREALKASLPLPEPETVNPRNVWLDTRVPKRAIYQVIKARAPSVSVITKSTVPLLPKMEVLADIISVETLEYTKREELDTNSTKEAETTEIAEQERILGTEPEISNAGEKGTNRRTKTTTRDAKNEERKAIEATLKELSINPEPGREGKRPIVIYSAFRSKFLGTPVTQVLGYEG